MATYTNHNHGNFNRYYDVFGSDDSFWDDYNKLGASYKNLVDPYLSYNYQQGIFDKIGNWLGFNTKEDNYRLQMQDRARLALASQLDNQFQNDYNSQMSQAQRMRDAGLNPDLSGEASGDSAGQNDQPFPLIDQSAVDPAPEIFSDLASIFGIATSGLQSVATFKSLLSMVTKTKEETSGVSIRNSQDAFNFAGDYLTSFDPEDRRDYDMTPDVFENEIIPSRIQAVDKQFSYMDDKARSYIKSAIASRRKDPRLFDAYYKNYSSGVLSRADKLANQKIFGSLDNADEVVMHQNKAAYRYLTDTAKARLRANKILADYNIKKYHNDFDYESFKQKYGIPELVVESELMQYVQQVFNADMHIAKDIATKEWLDYLGRLAKSKDPASVWLYNALIQGGYAPLLSKSMSGGAFGVNGAGSWNGFPVPNSTGSIDLMPRSGRTVYRSGDIGFEGYDNGFMID